VQARFGKTRLAAAMRCMYSLPALLVWGPLLERCFKKAYPMAEVTLPHIAHSTFTRLC
jgi:hypothetical protein